MKLGLPIRYVSFKPSLLDMRVSQPDENGNFPDFDEKTPCVYIRIAMPWGDDKLFERGDNQGLIVFPQDDTSHPPLTYHEEARKDGRVWIHYIEPNAYVWREIYPYYLIEEVENLPVRPITGNRNGFCEARENLQLSAKNKKQTRTGTPGRLHAHQIHTPRADRSTGAILAPDQVLPVPPLGLATLAGYLDDSDTAEIVDEHVEQVTLDDAPDLVAIEVYITRLDAPTPLRIRIEVVAFPLSWGIAPDGLSGRGTRARGHPCAGTCRRSLAAISGRLSQGSTGTPLPIPRPRPEYASPPAPGSDPSAQLSRPQLDRCFSRVSPSVRFLLHQFLLRDGKHFYTRPVENALAEIQGLPGRHLFFLDDNIFGNARFSTACSGGCAVWTVSGRARRPSSPF